MSAEDMIRSFAESREPDGAVIRDGITYGVARQLRARIEESNALNEKLEADFSAARVGIMALQGQLHDHLALMVGYLEEETSAGDGIQEQHFDGYTAAKSLLARTATNEPSWENAQIEVALLMKQASHVPGMSATLDQTTHELRVARARIEELEGRCAGASGLLLRCLSGKGEVHGSIRYEINTWLDLHASRGPTEAK